MNQQNEIKVGDVFYQCDNKIGLEKFIVTEINFSTCVARLKSENDSIHCLLTDFKKYFFKIPEEAVHTYIARIEKHIKFYKRELETTK